MKKKRLKRLIVLIMAAAIILSMFTWNVGGQAKKAEAAETYGDYSYEVNEGEITITGYSGSDSNIVIPSEINGEKVTSIGEFAFSGSLTSVKIPEGVKSIGRYAFGGCEYLKSIEIPQSVTTIGSEAFPSSVNSIKVNSKNKVYDSRNNCNAIIETTSNKLIAGCKNTIIPNSVTIIGDYAFEGCGDLTNIIIPKGVKSIGRYAFWCCDGLTEIKIPQNVKSVGVGAFCGCDSITDIEISEGVTSIGDAAFSGCYKLLNIEIPQSVTTIGSEAFPSSVNSIKVNSKNKVYDSRNNCNAIIETTSNKLIAGCKNTIIPNSITIIGDEAFSGCWNLTCIEIPKGVNSIGKNAFYATGLTNIEIPKGVTSIGESAFADCLDLETITIPESVISIGEYAFGEKVYMPVTIICPKNSYAHKYAIKHNKSVKLVGTATAKPKTPEKKGTILIISDKKIKVRVTSSNVSNLTVEVIKSTNKNVKRVSIPDTVTVNGFTYKVTRIANNAFKSNKKLKTVTIGSNVTKIGSNAFYGCTSLSKISIGKNVTSIGNKAFCKCTRLKSITIPAKVKMIRSGAFYGCRNLGTINMYLGKGKNISKNAFKGIKKKVVITLRNTGNFKTKIVLAL